MSQFEPTPRIARPLDYAAAGGAIARFMNAVYAWMFVGLATTAATAFWVSTQQELMMRIFRGPTLMLLILAELALVFVISYAVQKISAAVATLLFLVYAALNGLTLAGIFVAYAPASIALTFIVTAGTFGIMSLYGYTTGRDLSSWRGFLLMGLVGVLLGSIVNLFWANNLLYWVITYAGILVFVGLTAYDTQKLRAMAWATSGDTSLAARMSVVGSLVLYLDFINLFLFLLRIFGNRR